MYKDHMQLCFWLYFFTYFLMITSHRNTNIVQTTQRKIFKEALQHQSVRIFQIFTKMFLLSDVHNMIGIGGGKPLFKRRLQNYVFCENITFVNHSLAQVKIDSVKARQKQQYQHLVCESWFSFDIQLPIFKKNCKLEGYIFMRTSLHKPQILSFQKFLSK